MSGVDRDETKTRRWIRTTIKLEIKTKAKE